ncbi:MAG TPA: YncE family protein [Blastocatellia bacterium]
MKRHHHLTVRLSAFALIILLTGFAFIAGAQTAQQSSQSPPRKAQGQPAPEQQEDQPFYHATKPPNAPSPNAAKPLVQPAPSSESGKIEKEGIAVEFSISSIADPAGKKPGLVEGSTAQVDFKVTDSRTGQPVTGLHPSAWISAHKSERPTADTECRDKIKGFVGGFLTAVADIDLNKYVMLTLNSDKTISVINPLIAFSSSKLENLVELPGIGADWVLSPDKSRLYISMPGQSEVVVVNTIGWKTEETINTGDKTKPMHVALQPDGRYVWVGLDGSPEVVVIDSAKNAIAATVETGAGLHSFAFTDDGKLAYVTNSAADTVSVIDTKTLAKVADIQVDKTPIPVAYSKTSHFIYVASTNGTAISVIDPANQKVIARIPTERGVVALRFDPDGKYGFAVNQLQNKTAIIESATNSVAGVADVVKGPDQVTFTRGYAYIRGTESPKVSLVELNEVSKGRYTTLDVSAAEKSPADSPGDLGIADMIAPTPEGNSAMIASAPDGGISYYMEGVMAPMGTFSNYHRHARALMILDRSLSETLPGVYSLPVKLSKAGKFDVPLLIDQPRVVNCFDLTVTASTGDKADPAHSLAYEPLFRGQKFRVGEPVDLAFKITDSATKQPVTGLRDVQILIAEPPGIWETHLIAKEASPGVYKVNQAFPAASVYKVMVQVLSRGVKFHNLPFMNVPVYAAEATNKQ